MWTKQKNIISILSRENRVVCLAHHDSSDRSIALIDNNSAYNKPNPIPFFFQMTGL